MCVFKFFFVTPGSNSLDANATNTLNYEPPTEATVLGSASLDIGVINSPMHTVSTGASTPGSNSPNTYVDNSPMHSVATEADIFNLTPLLSSSEWKQANYTNLEKLLHRAIPQPHHFEGNFSSLCWHDILDFSAVPKIWSLKKEALRADLEQVRYRSIIAVAEAESNNRRLVCLPTIFIPSFPKCGSTSLFRTVTSHPFIQRPMTKEPHFFVRFPFQNDDDFDYLSVFTYLKTFERLGDCSETNPKCLSVDGSQSLLWDTRTSAFLDEVPLLINHIFPQPKFIVIMREPVNRFISDLWYFVYKYCTGQFSEYQKKINPRTLPKMLHGYIMKELDRIQGCLQNGNKDETCIHYSLLHTPKIFGDNCGEIRLGISVYYVHISRWLRTFPIDSFHFVRMEDLKADPYTVMKGIWKFLDIPPITKKKFRVDHEPSHSKSYPKLLPETEKALADFYQPYNIMLSNMLKDEKFLWSDV